MRVVSHHVYIYIYIYILVSQCSTFISLRYWCCLNLHQLVSSDYVMTFTLHANTATHF